MSDKKKPTAQEKAEQAFLSHQRNIKLNEDIKQISKLVLHKYEKPKPVKRSFVKEMYAELNSLKMQIKMRAYCDIIVQLFSDKEQDEIIGYLQDPNQQVRFEFHVFVTPRKEDAK